MSTLTTSVLLASDRRPTVVAGLRRLAALALAGCVAQLAGCDGQTTGNSNTSGALLGTERAEAQDAHQGGMASRLDLKGLSWGRLVDVYDFDAASQSSSLQHKDFVIGGDFVADGVDCVLESDWTGEGERLMIRHRAGSASFAAVRERLELGLEALAIQGPDAAGPFSSVPRDATLVLEFNDLLDAATINARSVAVFTGEPALAPHGARVLADAHHGGWVDRDGDGAGEFYTTRVLVDLAVDSSEALESAETLAVQALGLPMAESTDRANVLLRLPTRTAEATGARDVLRNLSGRALSASGNGPVDLQTNTRDLVRALRSRSGYVGDPGDGFSGTQPPPQVLGVQAVTLTHVMLVSGQIYMIDALFDVASCAPQPRVGDVIRVGSSTVASVVQAGSAPVGGMISGVQVSLRLGSPANLVPGPAQYEMLYDPSVTAPPACFVRFSPPPLQAPDIGVSPQATIRVRFTRPMDPRSVSGLDSMVVRRVSGFSPVAPFFNTVGATAIPSPDLREYTYQPTLPFERNRLLFPQGETYQFELRGGTTGALDRAGQTLLHALPAFNFSLDSAAASVNSRSLVLNFDSADQDGNGAPELRGQFLFDLSKGSIRARSVTRFAGVADASQPVLGLQIPFTAPMQTPLSNLGSKMMGVYRYHDLGFALTDDATMNIDLEHLAWAPQSAPAVDSFAQFQMSVAHSKFLPDELVNPMSLLPLHPNSGLVKVFDDNLLDPAGDPLRVTHDKQLGYAVQPVDAFLASTGTLMMPYPMNRGLPLDQFARYTWRDTAIQALGGPNGNGVDTDILGFAQGAAPLKHYSAGKVPTIGLPLLMEFRCYPDAGALGLNGLKVNIALNSSARPAFRAFSTGGGVLQVDPDNEATARGDLSHPGSLPVDPVFHIGQADFVVRVNRVHSIWFDSLLFTAQYQQPIVHPPSSFQPAGTQVVVALRGATNVTNGTSALGGTTPRHNANTYDAYGEPKALIAVLPGVSTQFVPTYPQGPLGQPDNTWKQDPAQINQLRFVQVRVTLISNPVTAKVPAISGFGLSLAY